MSLSLSATALWQSMSSCNYRRSWRAGCIDLGRPNTGTRTRVSGPYGFACGLAAAESEVTRGERRGMARSHARLAGCAWRWPEARQTVLGPSASVSVRSAGTGMRDSSVSAPASSPGSPSYPVMGSGYSLGCVSEHLAVRFPHDREQAAADRGNCAEAVAAQVVEVRVLEGWSRAMSASKRVGGPPQALVTCRRVRLMDRPLCASSNPA